MGTVGRRITRPGTEALSDFLIFSVGQFEQVARVPLRWELRVLAVSDTLGFDLVEDSVDFETEVCTLFLLLDLVLLGHNSSATSAPE